MIRRFFGAVSSVVGTVGVFGLVLTMNGLDRGPPEPPEVKAVSFDAPPPPKRPDARPARKPPERPKTAKQPTPPIPQIAAGIGGVDVGLFGAGAVDLREATDALVGGGSDVVMTAEAVDSLPVPVTRAAPAYPPSARSQGQTGSVTLTIDIDARGQVTDARVTSSSPPGVFDDAAIRGVRGWRFQAATYQGAPVAVRVEQTVRFDLERR
jgi:protein TonB